MKKTKNPYLNCRNNFLKINYKNMYVMKKTKIVYSNFDLKCYYIIMKCLLNVSSLKLFKYKLHILKYTVKSYHAKIHLNKLAA